jgi:hypothetical protein
MAFLFGFWNVLIALPGVVFRKSKKLIDYLSTNFAEVAMLVFIVIYWATSIASNLNIGVRHVLPTVPFIYMLTAGAIRRWISIKNWESTRNLVVKIFVVYREFWSVSLKTAVLASLCIWYLISAAVTAPHFLSYFNFFSGGTKNGYQLVTDSNYDWGQDLKRLKYWVEENLPEGDRMAVDYFGGGNPKYYLDSKLVEPWWSARGNPLNEGIKWLAVSINTIQNARSPIGEVNSWFERKPEDEYRWLTEPYKFHARAGTSIFIYKLE